MRSEMLHSYQSPKSKFERCPTINRPVDNTFMRVRALTPLFDPRAQLYRRRIRVYIQSRAPNVLRACGGVEKAATGNPGARDAIPGLRTFRCRCGRGGMPVSSPECPARAAAAHFFGPEFCLFGATASEIRSRRILIFSSPRWPRVRGFQLSRGFSG